MVNEALAKKQQELDEARILKKKQDKIRNRFEFLKNVPHKYFQVEYVKAQAEEICNYLKEMEMSPLNPWYSALVKLTSEGDFMSQFYLTYNEFGVVEPDYKRIDTLVMPDPKPEDFPRSIIFG
jgi:hypothetical protein